MERSQITAKLSLSIIGLWLFWSVSAQAATAVNVAVGGCVEEPQTIQYQSKVSLFQVLQQANLTECNYMLGASWSKESLKAAQHQQKIALLQLVKHMIKNAEDEASIDYLSHIQQLVQSQTVSGRVVEADLEPYHVEILPLKNRILTEDSRFYFPQQPDFINLIGFSVQKHGYDSEQSITDIYSQYDLCASCTHGWLWLVQPNGEVSKHKAGVWTSEKFYLAPGGWLISPIDEGQFDDFAIGFNKKLAAWLATQVVNE